ncbi:transcriptional regulator [Serinicoccus hydrothermalis]|uniref:Transcriptional regulator n=1 Tax=Serinicoccus hydrothermalis TaxID=1758689 RepID=A0A1B1NBX7_9MICO|nr:response regulator transcription factor [Serinicoccus hydrothermalis]ANS78933.1 transcriptional regulator [Serinicoccus hydrothermalis]
MNAQPGSVGLTEAAEQLYRHVLRSAPAPMSDHAEALGWPLRQTERVMQDLEQMRLARRTSDGTVKVDDPRASVGRLLDAEESDLDERRRRLLGLRESLESFESDYRRGLQLSGPRVPAWEQVAPTETGSVVEHLVRTSRGPILWVTVTPDAVAAQEAAVRRQSADGMGGSGRDVRGIFPLSVLTDPQWHSFAQWRAGVGEQQRYLPDDGIRVEFAVFGRSGVLLQEKGEDAGFLLLRAPVILDAFVALFDELWRRAEPVMSRDASAQDVKLLELLSLGFKDEAIARQMSLGLRTVRRRVAALMEEHGADTRFQLGLAVCRRGLVE